LWLGGLERYPTYSEADLKARGKFGIPIIMLPVLDGVAVETLELSDAGG